MVRCWRGGDGPAAGWKWCGLLIIAGLGLWVVVGGGAVIGEEAGPGQEFAVPRGARRVRLDVAGLRQKLGAAPPEGRRRAVTDLPEVSLPLPDGSDVRFLLEESLVMAPELAARHPEIRSYRGVAADGSGATMRGDWSPHGFHATILLGGETFLIHPTSYAEDERRPGGAGDYFSYAYSDQEQRPEDLVCDGPIVPMGGVPELPAGVRRASLQSGQTLKTFRLALATTQEFTNAPGLGGGSVAGAMAALNTLVNSLNALYERELAIRFVLVANNSQVVFAAEPDPFTNSTNSTMLNEVRSVMRDRIGYANFDLGLVIGTAGGGVAYLGVVCNNSAGNTSGLFKGGGVGSANPAGPVTGALFVMSHEIGHMFRAYHSFNASCSGNRSGNEAWESGSGLTIMAYPGSCSQAITYSADLRFHGGSLTSIRNFVDSLSCPTNSLTGNQMPTIDAGPGYNIPANTPFVLSATASDPDVADQANLNYTWEQYDAGGSNYISPPYDDSGDTSATTRPIFRPLLMSKSSQRVFPSLSYILNNANDPPALVNGLQTAEELPRIGRTLNFIATVRDMRGGVATDTVSLAVSGSAGPFLVTSPNGPTTWAAGTTQTVQWAVANTNSSPINCNMVRILLSTDGGTTFPVTLANLVPNTGTATFVLPAVSATSQARIRVEAIGNIFFDISDTNFSISSSSVCAVTVGPAALATGASGSAYSQSLTQSGLTGAVTWSLSSGTLPAGLSLGSTTGVIAGTPTQSGSFAITVRATGANGCFGERGYQLTIGCSAVTVGPAALATGGSGSAYSQSLTQSGLTGAVTWSLSSGTLPAGLSLGSTTGVIAGTPTQSGSFVITVRATGANGCFGERGYQLTIGCSTIGISPAAISPGAVNAGYTLTFTASGVPGRVYWTRSGTLPPGMNFDTTAGQLFGTPYFTGTWAFTITAADAVGCSFSRSYNLVVSSASVGSYEGDTALRPLGSGMIDVSDFIQAGRFVVGIEQPMPGSEFQRADTAPFETSGNGLIDINDWVQTGRYATGLDARRQTGGQAALRDDQPLEQNNNLPLPGSAIRAVESSGDDAESVKIGIELDSLGIENAILFTLRFDEGRFELAEIQPGAGTLILNRRLERQGMVGVGIALAPGFSFERGTRRLLSLRLIAGRKSPRGAGPIVWFDDSLVRRQMATPQATHLSPPLPIPATGVRLKAMELAVR